MSRLGLRSKFFFASNAIVVASMVIMTGLAAFHARGRCHATIQRNGLAIARTIAQSLSGPVADTWNGGEAGAGGFLERVVDDNPDSIEYAQVVGADGNIELSDSARLAGKAHPRAADLHGIPAAGLGEFVPLADGSLVLEARVPIGAEQPPQRILVVGFSTSRVQEEVWSMARRAMLLALAVILTNAVVTGYFVESQIRPILALYETIMRASRGQLNVRAPVKRWDEVGELSDAFNRMMDELEGARELDQLRQAQLVHTEKMAAVGTLAAGVAHEVNNPLAGILTCIENLRAHPDDGDMAKRYLDLIYDGIRRIERTVANLLDFSRPRETSPQATSLNQAIRNVVELVDYQLRKAEIRVRLDLDPDKAIVVADKFQMEQLLLNLVLNAIQAMPSGGSLALRARTVAGRVITEVIDTGEGIPEMIRDRIFDPFFTTREVGEGTGLGLAVSYGIVTSHGGWIEVESVIGKGSIFRVFLPARKEEQEERRDVD